MMWGALSENAFGVPKPGPWVSTGPGISVLSAAGTLPALPALRELLPRGELVRGSVVSVAEFGVLALALLAGASADRAWCGIAGVPVAGILAAAELGLDLERTLLVPDLGDAWPQLVASLLDGCEIVLVRRPGRPPAQVRQRLEAVLRRGRSVLLIAGDWPGMRCACGSPPPGGGAGSATGTGGCGRASRR
jgi:hypothetical protein